MARIIILVENQYEDRELWYPYHRLIEAGHEPLIVGRELKVYLSKHGMPVRPKALLKDVNSEEFDGVIIPGGYAPDLLRTYPVVLDFVRAMDAAGKLVASICHAAWVLVSAGIVKGRKMACYYSIKDDVKNAGAEYVDEQVVVDKNLITSRMPRDLPFFMREVLKFLG